MTDSNDRLVDEAEAATILNIKKQTLGVWRCSGRYKLPFFKAGRAVRYRVSDLEEFIAARTVLNTAQADQLEAIRQLPKVEELRLQIDDLVAERKVEKQ